MFDTAAYLESVFRDCIRSEADLYDEQVDAVDWLYDRPFSALFLDVGKGKTVIVETLLDRLLTEGFNGKILIIAPIRVATRVWMREHRLWEHVAYFNPNLIRIDDDDPRLAGVTGKKRVERKHLLLNQAVKSKRQIHVINQEAVPWLVSHYIQVLPKSKLREIARWPYQIVIFDESSRLRDHNSEIFKSLKRVRHRMKRFHQLTATPASQTYMHLFSQIYLLDEGKRFGKTITPFREKYFSHNPWSQRWAIREDADREIEEKIADICLVMRREKNFQINTRRIELAPSLMRQYRDFEEDAVLDLPEGPIDAGTAATLSNKLLQYASGAVYDESKRVHPIHDEKIENLRSLIDETLDQPIIVAYWYKSSLTRLRKTFPTAAVMDREGKMEEGWNKRKFKIMFVHPRGSAHGLNLQFGGHHIALFDIFWPLELFTQLIGRLDRDGQTHTVMVHLLSAIGTMDEVVSANLEHLRGAEDDMKRRLEAIHRRLKNDRKRRQLVAL